MANIKAFEKSLLDDVKNKSIYANTQLDVNELEHLRDIFNSTIVKKNNDKNNITQITKKFNKTSIISINDEYIRNLAIEYLKYIGLYVNENNFMIEYWRYRCFGDKLNSVLPRHKDSYGALLCPINTCIFYIRKDKTLKGGNLNIYDNSLFGYINKIPNKTIMSSNNNVVLMDGDLIHQITAFEGTGIRDIIVVQFEKAFEITPIFCNMIKKKRYNGHVWV
jgi:hypothetical protein